MKYKRLQRLQHRTTYTGIECNININDIEWTEYCPVFNVKLIYENNHKYNPNVASFDRLDPSKGYIKGNVIIISWKANLIKHNSTSNEIYDIYTTLEKIIKGDKIEQKFIDNKIKSKRILTCIKHKAKKYGNDFNLTLDDIKLPEKCPILNININYNNNKMLDNSPSIDKIDPPKGYTKGNIWIISKRANTIKNNASIEELKKLYTWMKNNNL